MREPDHSSEAARFELTPLPAGRVILHLKTLTRAPASLPDGIPGVRGGARLLTVGPGEWLMIGDSVGGPGLPAAAAGIARAHGVAAVDVSDGLAGLQLGGTGARDVLATACGLDLHPSSFGVGSCTRTRLAQLPVVIECTEGRPSYALYVGRSYLAYLEAWLRDAAVA